MSNKLLTVKEMDDNVKAIVAHACKELNPEQQAKVKELLDKWRWRPGLTLPEPSDKSGD